MELREQRRLIRNLESYFILRERPEKVTDLSVLEKALQLMESASRITGEEYVYKCVQQFGIGDIIELFPKEYNPSPRVNPVIATYDKEYFKNHIRKLKGEEYQ